MDYDDEIVEDFVSNIFDPNSSTITPSSSPKTKNHLKKDDEQKQSQSEPENTDLNSGPEKADSEPVSKSPELRRKKKKEDETPGSEPVNPECGIKPPMGVSCHGWSRTIPGFPIRDTHC